MRRKYDLGSKNIKSKAENKNRSNEIESSETSKETKFSKPQLTSFKKLYRYTNATDIFLLLLAIAMSVAIGAAFPINMLVFKEVINLLIKKPSNTYLEVLMPLIRNFALIAGGTFIAGTLQALCIFILGEHMKSRLKVELFASLLRQDISWFDSQQTGRLITHITDDIDTIESGIVDKVIQFIQYIGTFISCMIVAFTTQWLLTFVGLSVVPVMLFIFLFLFRFVKKCAIAQMKAYSTAGGIAEEILSGVKTVVAFNAIETEVDRYAANLIKAEKYGIKKTIFQGVATGTISLVVWLGNSLVFYVGLIFFENGRIENPGDIVLIFFTVVLSSIALGNAVPLVENIMQAMAAGFNIFQIIDRVPIIDLNKKGNNFQNFNGDIEFRNVDFEYPTRPGVQILKNFSFTIPQGKRVAFIGPSGSGKSTIIHLLQRFYDPCSGSVNLGGHNITELDLSWYRSKIGVVHQEPPLFNGTIADNIRLGKLDATDEEITEAAKKSNAYEFIMKTKQQFETKLGDMGSGFSGGQKQRIAIATALVGNRNLLLLDEATSALDTISEKQVQETIDENLTAAGNTVTVVMVAHRLQTVRNADIIVVMKPGGEVVEHGNHDELIKLQGMYYEMLQKQNSRSVNSEEEIFKEQVPEHFKEETSEEEIKRRVSRKYSEVELTELTKSDKFQALKDFSDIMKLNRPESKYIVIGVLSSIFVGILFPCASLIYAQMFQIFTYRFTNIDLFHKQRDLFCGLMLLPAFSLLIGHVIKNICFAMSGEILTTRLRKLLLLSILRQEMAWFDEPAHQPGVLVGRLAVEASQVKGAAGVQIGIFFEAGSCLLAALAISFIFNWMLTLLFILIYPMIILSGVIQGRNMHSNANVKTAKLGGPVGMILEGLNNIRVLHSLNLQTHYVQRLRSILGYNKRTMCTKLFLYSVSGGIGTCGLYVAYCIVFRVGATLLDDPKQNLQMIDLMRVFACMSLSAAALGRALALASDVEKARISSRLTLNTLSRQSNIDPLSNKGSEIAGIIKSKIDFKDVRFCYNSRPNATVLQDLNATIEPRQSVALVGHSGCGKSTVVQLLLRFYDPLPDSGSIMLDGYDLRCLNVRWLRSQIGLVQQEPRLFNISVTDNICLGLTKEEVDMERVQVVAKAANIHDFIATLPEGYDTRVGQRGGHLSGGQKQRLCIARALYREPALLLLDEATSALDNESEAVVQEALNAASRGRTSVTVAHRLTTVRDCDSILVLERGRVAEAGSHDQLMAHHGGIYNRLYCGSADST